MRFDPQQRASCWSLTINNPVESDYEACRQVKEIRGWTLIGQPETGKEGTKHLQFYLKTLFIRGSAVKKHFPRAHIEKAINPEKLLDYVQKTDTATGDVMIIENKWLNFRQIRQKFFEGILSEKHECDVYDLPVALDFDARLRKWDNFICEQLAEGIECGDIGVNPQYRSQIGKYWDGFIEFVRRQTTDRQTDENLVSTVNIPVSNGFQEDIPEASSSSPAP